MAGRSVSRRGTGWRRAIPPCWRRPRACAKGAWPSGEASHCNFVGLDNIQSHLENPFDRVGEDDIQINAEKFIARLELRSEAARAESAVGQDPSEDTAPLEEQWAR